jgi:hypothetical protein
MALASLLHALPRRASLAAFLNRIPAQCECPDIAATEKPAPIVEFAKNPESRIQNPELSPRSGFEQDGHRPPLRLLYSGSGVLFGEYCFENHARQSLQYTFRAAAKTSNASNQRALYQLRGAGEALEQVLTVPLLVSGGVIRARRNAAGPWMRPALDP